MIDSTRREVFLCPDCGTPRMVSTPHDDGALQVVVHDDSCPTFAGMSEDERYQVFDFGTLLHLSAGEVPTPGEGPLELERREPLESPENSAEGSEVCADLDLNRFSKEQP